MMPSTFFNSISVGLASKRSASSGEMPGWIMVVMMTGTVTSGLNSTGMARKDKKPARIITPKMVMDVRALSRAALKYLIDVTSQNSCVQFDPGTPVPGPMLSM